MADTPNRLRTMIRDVLAPPPATTSADAAIRPSSTPDLSTLQAGDIEQRVAPDPASIDPYPEDEHAHPYTHDELEAITPGPGPTGRLGPPTPAPLSAGAFARRFTFTALTALPVLVVPADPRPRRIRLRTITADAYVYPIRPQYDGVAADPTGYLIPAAAGASPETHLDTQGEVWAIGAAGAVLHVWVDYTPVTATTKAAGCGCKD
jgi:hypothetical protein